MVEKLVCIGNDFWIQNEQGKRAYKVDGKPLRIRETLIFRDQQGEEVCKIEIGDRFVVNLGNERELDVQGNVLSHEYRIADVASISKKWFRVRDSYGVEVPPGQNDPLVLATTVCIEQMVSDVG